MEDVGKFFENSGVSVFCNGKKSDGSEFYAYVLMSIDNFEKYQEILKKKKSYNIEDFGEIVAEGNTLNPPKSVRLEMALLYGFDHQFENKLEEFFGGEEEDFS
jgi:hypothetical protein